MTKVILLILSGELLAMMGQVFFKKSINKLEPPHFKNIASYLNFANKILARPLVWLGFCFIGIGVVFFLTALSLTNLSIAFPIDSMQYIVALIYARIFLGEHIDRMKLLGTTLVVLGIIFVAIS